MFATLSRTTTPPYDGDESFLEGPTDATNRLWGKKLQELQKEERARRSALIWRQKLSAVSQHMARHILTEHERSGSRLLVFRQINPLNVRSYPYGGIKMAEKSCEMYG